VAGKTAGTRAHILEAAMQLFRRQGFEATTMREIAAEAQVATGAAYYYFDSKDAIALAFYAQAQQELAPLLDEALAGAKNFKDRLSALLEVKLKYFEPNRRLLAALAAHADPAHPLSPFGAQTREIRERDMEFFGRLLKGGRVRLPSDLQPHLPRILWTYQMGVLLFWIYDRSADQQRTRQVIQKSVALVAGLVKAAGFPLLRPVRKLVVALMEAITEAE
jgi:AcrR family transcriptional regulator